ncbi:MAG: HisA/HisF-related TIM barrel protein, partial [bacterium]
TAGCQRVIIGTAGVKNPDWLEKLVSNFGPDRIVAGVDCEAGEVMIRGWEEASLLARNDWLARLEDLGIEKIVYTDVGRDGTQHGPDTQGVREILKNTTLEVIASGGIGKIEHLLELKEIDSSRLVGVIIGRALYERNFTLQKALKAIKD